MIRPQQARRVLFCSLLIGWAAGLSQARFLSPKEAKHSPQARIACVPSPTMGVRYFDADDLGQHDYRSGRNERNGIVYTCRGGHIDVTHLRKIADWTAQLAYQTREALVRGDRVFKFKMFEPSQHYVQIEYPPGWKYLTPKTRREIAGEVSVSLGAYLAYTCSVWHEILTWHGFKAIGFYPEYNSAFSWEDNFSNALGSYLGAQALRDRDHDYDGAMTRLIHEKFQQLGPQSKETAREAGLAVKGSWFVGAFVRVTMTKRHLDVGLDDGYVTPWLVPNVAKCGTPEPWPCPVPNLRLLDEYGFRIHHKIRPKEWEKGQILRAVYPDAKKRKKWIMPAEHFGILMEHVRAQVDERYGPYAHLRQAPAPAQPQLAQTTGEQRRPAVTSDSSRTATVGLEPHQDDLDERPSRSFFDFLGSAVSW